MYYNEKGPIMPKAYKEKKAAERYDSARELPNETINLWMDNIQRIVPLTAVSRVLDLGGGTGRFAGPLHKAYKCPVTVIDPSKMMLEQGVKRKISGISWVCGVAECHQQGE
jgi:ubiquinone/menaquinone biosynthesis C-methylase UbiE